MTGLALLAWQLLARRDEPPPALPGNHPAATEAPAAAQGAVEPARALPPDPSVPPPTHGTLDVHLAWPHAPAGARAEFVVLDGGRQVAKGDARDLTGGDGTPLAAPIGRWLTLGCTTFGGTDPRGAAVPPLTVRLDAGERRRVDFTVTNAATTLRVLGPSLQLAPLLTLELQPNLTRLGASRSSSRWRLDDRGCVRLHLPGGSHRARLLGEQGGHPLLTRDGSPDFEAAGEVLLSPLAPLVGIRFGSPDGAATVALSLDGPGDLDEAVTPLLCTRQRAEAATTLHGFAPTLGAFQLPMREVLRHDDLWTAVAATAVRTATLRVSTGAPDEPLGVATLEAEPLPEGRGVPLQRATTGHRAELPPGDYRLIWRIRGGRGPIAIERLSLAPGQHVDLDLVPPVLQRWTAELFEADAQRAELWLLRLGDVHSLGGARDGRFLFDFVEPPALGTTGELWSAQLRVRFPATVVGVDHGSRRLGFTSPLQQAVWVRLRARGTAGGALTARLAPADGDPRGSLLVPANLELPLLPATHRDGALYERLTDREQLIAWFRLQATAPEALVEGRGQGLTLRLERPVLSAAVYAVGPFDDTPLPIFTVQRSGEYPLFVAIGTRRIVVEAVPGGTFTFDPAGPFVVR